VALGKAGVSVAERGPFRAAVAYLRRSARRVAADADRSDVRQMATEIPGTGWRAYSELSPTSKSLVRALEKDRVVGLRPGEVGTEHLAELTRYFNGEVAVIQGPAGDLKLLRGEADFTRIPAELWRQDYAFTIHTHPEDRIPGEFTELDKARGLPNGMVHDLSERANGIDTHIEAVVNRLGDVTYFDHMGILPAPDGWLSGGPINHLGLVIPVQGL
jgi:hypothetical protein